MNTTVNNDGLIINIIGELNFNTVPLLTKDNRQLIDQNQKIIFDLAQVTSSDNAGVALLVYLTGYAKNISRDVSFVNLPQQLLTLAEANGVRDILPIS